MWNAQNHLLHKSCQIMSSMSRQLKCFAEFYSKPTRSLKYWRNLIKIPQLTTILMALTKRLHNRVCLFYSRRVQKSESTEKNPDLKFQPAEMVLIKPSCSYLKSYFSRQVLWSLCKLNFNSFVDVKVWRIRRERPSHSPSHLQTWGILSESSNLRRGRIC